MTDRIKSTAEARPDLIHPFQWQPGREEECSHFYLWLGGYVKCGQSESSSIHRNGPHTFVAADGERAYCSGHTATCEACFQEFRLSRLDEDKQASKKTLRSLRKMSGAEFGEACADVAKAIERSRR